MNLFSFSYVGSLFFLALAVVGTTILGSTPVWADVFEGTEGPDRIVGTPLDDIIDSKGGDDRNFGDTQVGDGSGDDVINSGEGDDANFGDTANGQGSGDDIIDSGEGNDLNFGDTSFGNGSGNDIIFSGEGDDENYGDTLNDHE
jgi:hypothetical protein